MRENYATWEDELWRYISTGDGDSCPVYDHCDLRQKGHWCINEHVECMGNMGYLINDNVVDSQRGEVISLLRPGRIFTLVEMLAQKYLELGNVSSPPVPESLIDLVGHPDDVEVRLVPLTAYHGALWHIDESWIIQLNENDADDVRRLTLFHEAFHILAHCCSTPVFRKVNSNKGSFNELLAEYFTYNILMPVEWIKSKWVEFPDPDVMAEIFKVPKSAMLTMLRSLQAIDFIELPTALEKYHGTEDYPFCENVQNVLKPECSPQLSLSSRNR